MDTTYPSARDTTEVYGELLDGVVVLRMEYDEEDECECCRREGGYHITGLGCYSAFCREHLAEQPGVFRVVESEEELADIGMKPVEVTR